MTYLFIYFMFVTFHPPQGRFGPSVHIFPGTFVPVWWPPSKERLGLWKSCPGLDEFSWLPVETSGPLLLYVSAAAIKRTCLESATKDWFQKPQQEPRRCTRETKRWKREELFLLLFCFFTLSHCRSIAKELPHYHRIMARYLVITLSGRVSFSPNGATECQQPPTRWQHLWSLIKEGDMERVSV